jgi:hypothetical protein
MNEDNVNYLSSYTFLLKTQIKPLKTVSLFLHTRLPLLRAQPKNHPRIWHKRWNNVNIKNSKEKGKFLDVLEKYYIFQHSQQNNILNEVRAVHRP